MNLFPPRSPCRQSFNYITKTELCGYKNKRRVDFVMVCSRGSGVEMADEQPDEVCSVFQSGKEKEREKTYY